MKLSEFDFRIYHNIRNEYIMDKDIISSLFNDLINGATDLTIDYKLELFTGLYDKKGKKVYENDIVKVKSLYDYFLAKISIHKEGTFYFEGKNGDYIGSLIYLVEDEGYTIEAIGNIHENAELLK
ncbi:YopX family protein [Campylobacter coli]|uniref:YopX family protein n=1 Tax=Campylobacter coli TaxID=195 RepID=UPI001271991F|nr:YopX family protein [Campylobacter coli]EAK0311103.1 hypothetical protein [Campylobacter coli]EAK7356393.1 hypothetical protein [Campylobacter coli]ECC0590697.1 hypothetical protein [Campylobacter coli]ECH5756036.1 hypothetical protein [Campylobacter coli]EDO6855458.1 hypothetical protein [Campylobacter coli]